jgi:hypothetical protein
MRTFRLNGWQRIGTVLSMLWAVVGRPWGNHIAIQDHMPAYPSLLTCLVCGSAFKDAEDAATKAKASAKFLNLNVLSMRRSSSSIVHSGVSR